MIFTIVI